MKDKMFCKKNAFTLVEIIAAVIVMGIIAIIAVPSVIRYINDSTETTYLSYENSMEDAAKNHVIKCVDENNPNCLLPEQGEKKLVYLSDLVNSGYIDDMKDPKSDNFCESEISYVEIANSGNTDFEYTACLYCGQYKTKDAACTLYSNDSDDPVCGIVTGDSTRWTNTNRKITVECSDKSSGCISNTFSKTFNSTVKESFITIADKSGRTKNCPVNVYVDKTLPTCELEVTKGQLESSGWYSGEVEVTLKNQKDNESGLLTYGIGTSINGRNYNKGTTIKVNDGITTVMGYVKDKAGNEGVCSLDVRVGEAKPEYFIEYGYQIYPDKETYTVSGMTQTGNTFTATSNDPQIAFTGLSEYRNVNKVVVYFETPVANNSFGQVFYSNGTHSEANSVRNVPIASGSSKVEFVIPKGTYNNIRIDLGSTSGLSYNIRRIELRVGDRSILWTNKDVSVVLLPEAGRYNITEYSFDNGATWQTKEYKEFSSNNSNIVTKAKNYSGLVSDSKIASITNIDKVKPTVTITAKKKTSGTVVATNSWSTEGLNFILTSGNVGISGATIYYCQDRNNTCNPTTTVATGTTITALNTIEDTYYVRYKVVSGAGTNSDIGSYTAKVDIKKPTVTSVSGNPTIWTNQNVTLTVNGAADNTGGSGLQANAYSFDNGATWQTGKTKTYTSNTNNIIIKVRDNAGNVYTHSTINITKIDKSNPTVSIVAKKKTSGTTVATNTWSTEGLNFVLTSGNVGISGATIYNCQDRNNTCNPTTTVATGTTITSLNTTEDTYYVRYKVVSGAGTSSAVGSYTAKVDIKKPTVTSVSGNPTTWTNQNVTLTVNGASDNTGGSGLQANAYSFDNGVTWQAGNTKTYTANSNNIIIKVRDNVGNIYTHSAINITKIDKIAPTITSVSGNPTAWTNQNVTLTVNGAADNTGGSGLQASAYSFDNGVTWQAGNTKTYTANTNNIIIKVRDNAGNIYTNSSINITKIDKIAPTCTSSGDSTSWTNSNRTIYYGCSDSNSGCNSSYSGGSQTFSTTTKTASISAYEIRDNAGNVTSCPLKTVNVYVDKIAPTCTNSGDSTSWTNSSRTIYYGCSDSNSGCNSSYSGGSRTVSSSAQTVTISAYEIRDNAGNSVTCPARTAKTYVDKNSPTCSFSYETKEWTNKKIGVTFSARDTGGSKIAYYTYTFLGSTTRFDAWNNEFSSQQVWGNTSSPVVFRVYDAAGNSGSCTLSISNVDQEKPTCTMSISPSGWTNGSVTATINGTDSLSGISSYQFNYDGGWSSSNKKTITSESGSSGSFIYGYVKDRAGNQNESACIGTYKIDKTAPSCSITASGSQSNGWYTGDVTLKSTYSDALSGVGSYGMGAFSSAVYNSLNEVTRTGDTSGLTFKCFVKDNAGNTASRSITIKKDSTKPTCSWTHGSWGTTTTATITGSDATSGVAQINAGDGYKSGSSTTKKFTSAGTHTGFVKDKAGNTNTCSITISKRTRYRQRSCSTCSSCSSAGYNYGSWTSDGGGCYGSNMSSSYPKSSATNLVAYDSCVKQVGTGRGCKVGQYYCKKYKRTRTAKSSCSACGCSSWGSWTGYNYDSCSASSTATSKKECESREEYR